MSVVVNEQFQNYSCEFFSYYDGDQDKLFNDAHVVNPFRRVPESVQQARVDIQCNFR